MVYRLNEIPHNGLKKRVSIDLRNIDIGLPKTVNGNVHGSKKLVCTFDEAAELTGIGIFHIVLLLSSGFALLGAVLEGLNMAVVLPAAKCDLDLTTGEQGMINAIAFLGFVLTSQFWGFMADTWGRRKVLRFALGTGFAFSAISSLSVNTTMLIVTRLCVGLTISGVMSASISYLSEFHSNKTRMRHVTFAAMFMTMSVFYQALMGLFILPRDWEFSLFGWMLIRSWRIYILLSSLVNAFAFIAFCMLPESPKFMLAQGQPDEAIRILSCVYAGNRMGKAENYPVHRIEDNAQIAGANLSSVRGPICILRLIWQQTKPLLRREQLLDLTLSCFLTFSMFIVSHGFYMWYPQILDMYYANMYEPITVCRAIDLGFAVNGTAATMTDVLATEAAACVNTTSDPMTYTIAVIMGLGFGVVYTIAVIISEYVGMTNILGKRLGIFTKYFPPCCTFSAYFMGLVFWILSIFLICVGLIFTQNFYLNVVLIGILISAGSCGSIISGAAAYLFPTNVKGMALCFVMMSGRVGAVVGSNIIGALLEGNCNYVFGLLSAFMLFSSGVGYYIMTKIERIKHA